MKKTTCPGGGVNWEFQCKFCNAIFKGLYTRVKAHLMKLTGKGISICKKVTNKNLVKMQNAIDEAKLKSLNSQLKKAPLPPSVSFGAMSHSQGEARRRRSSDASGSGTMSGGAIGKTFNIKERDHVMVEIARMFYSAGLPFHLARNPYFVSVFSHDATHNIPGLVPLEYNLLRTTLLQREKANVDNLLQPIRSTWEQNGWDSIDYILKFTGPIYDMIRACDTDIPCLHLVYDMWDSMIEQVKAAIYRHEGKMHEEDSTFGVIHQILVDRWNKNNTPLHCLTYSLNPRVPPHKDEEVSRERLKCLKRYIDNHIERTKVNSEFAKFPMNDGPFKDVDFIRDRGTMNPCTWWVVYGSFAPFEDTCATFFLIVVRGIRVLTPFSLCEKKQDDTKKSKRLDNFDSLDDIGVLEIVNLSLDEPEMEAVLFKDVGVEEEDNIDDEA
ncbi:hypothetical protein Acr_23g0000050 [Actinidia rufa]|uniref:HAT transposon superfamily protein n=1 Tax=Actinidia rufa TaxID=165716 RepID=A0A7J0GLF4_9ERIC|nr:hypothetical protein Acr_23g0000050 [Actinidia rufa]